MTLTPPAPAPLRSPSTLSHGAVARRLRASAGQRAGAYLIDVAIVTLIGAVVWLLTGSLPLLAVTVVELWVIGWVWEGHTGATPGNLACGIRTVRRDAGVTVGAARLLPRSLVMGLAHVLPVLLPVGLAASGALDGLSGARVIDVRKARQDPAALAIAPMLDARVIGTGAGEAPGAVGVITATPLTRPDASVEPAPAPAAAPVQPGPSGAGTVPVFELADGTVIQATGLGFIGRAPRAPESIPDAILVRVPDGARSLSRTHASFGVEDEQLWVQDLGSANGASVRHLGGGVTELTPQTPYFLVPGDVLVLGGDAELVHRRVVGRGAAPAAAPAPVVSAPRSEPAALAPSTEAPAPSAEALAPSAEAPAPAPEVLGAREPDAPTPSPVVSASAVAVPEEPAAPPQAAVALRFQDGTTVPIHGTGYIGRAPALPAGERADAALITVPDGDRSVSRTHGRFGVIGDQTWFEDLGSGNGSSMRTSDGRSGPMTPHQRFGLVPGMTLQLGDCIVYVVAG
ncbi:FHA domain-containing protein [Microbacterium sp. NPDC058342]|uniref:FHA domain-containing protein n=1 Tax=Microbacterium sp. NPDC058342 TaxID=3346454 RepID=UPI0036677DFB